MSKSFDEFTQDLEEAVIFGKAEKEQKSTIDIQEGFEIFAEDIKLGVVQAVNSEFVLYEDVQGELKSVASSVITEAKDKNVKGDDKEYEKFFKGALKKFGVEEPDQLEGDKEKEFYDYVDANWKGDKESD